MLCPNEGRTIAFLEEVWRLPRGDTRFITVVVPEQFRTKSWLSAVGRASFRLKLRLLSEPGVVVANVPAVTQAHRPDGSTPERLVVRVLVNGVHGASIRAVNYARSLGVDDTRAVMFAFDAEEAKTVVDEWQRAGLGAIPMDLSEAPYRDVGTPLLSYLREITDEPGAVVNVVMPEIVVRGWARLLHNQRALYIKRLLLFERHVVLSSVPYQLFR
jgi:hypothetical protein